MWLLGHRSLGKFLWTSQRRIHNSSQKPNFQTDPPVTSSCSNPLIIFTNKPFQAFLVAAPGIEPRTFGVIRAVTAKVRCEFQSRVDQAIA
jgi:hypothetical protein